MSTVRKYQLKTKYKLYDIILEINEEKKFHINVVITSKKQKETITTKDWIVRETKMIDWFDGKKLRKIVNLLPFLMFEYKYLTEKNDVIRINLAFDISEDKESNIILVKHNKINIDINRNVYTRILVPLQ